jgi:2-amino-4-hydroxy-6-hydroxymethyldihydropteridine diphosphokinase
MPVTAFIAIGANLGDPVATARAALDALHRIEHARVVAASSLYRTTPVGLRNQPDFINAVAALAVEPAALPPSALLERLLAIEAAFGRVRTVKNAPRTLDLDLLLYGDTQSDATRLTLPHPRMTERAFVLVPLAEIVPDLVIPGRGEGKPVAAWLPAVAGQSVERLAQDSLMYPFVSLIDRQP